MTRLLHILSQRPGRSGSGVFLKAMVREADARGYEQHVVAYGPPGTNAQELPPLSDAHLSPVIFPCEDAPFDLPGNSNVMPYPSTRFCDMTDRQVDQYLEAGRRVLRKVRDEFRPDLVHAHHLFLATALARDVFRDTPVVATAHNAALRLCLQNPRLMPRVLPGIRRLDRIGVLTTQSQQDTIDMYGVDPARIALTQAGYRGDQFFVASESRKTIRQRLVDAFGVSLPSDAGGEKLVTFVGRLSTAKGIPFLLNALQNCGAETPPFRLLLVGATGSGEDGRRIGEMADRSGPGVVQLGAVPEAAVALILQCSDVFVLPSLFEGLPLTMLEAAASGCRCVVSELPTIRSWVPPRWAENGWMHLVPRLKTVEADKPIESDIPRFEAALASRLKIALQQSWSDGEREEFGREMQAHTWPAVFDRYEALYSELLGRDLAAVADRAKSDA